MAHEFLHVQQLSDIKLKKPTYLAIGSFDGVHIGHQTILKRLVHAAHDANVQAAVLTFFPHPKRVVRNLKGRYYLSTLKERQAVIRDMGVNLLITHPFNEEVRQTKAAVFMQQLVDVMDLKQLWGGDFALGHNREGDVPFLRQLGQTMGFTVESTATLVQHGDLIVSSSRIREHLQGGGVQEANACLGRPYQLSGIVVQGDQRGRTIGFPTANIEVWEEQLLPMNGVYATLALLDGKPFPAATNIGIRPTVEGQTMRVEAHLLNFEQDIYGRELTLQFIDHVRPETKFESLSALKAQIDQDVKDVQKILNSYLPFTE